MKAVIQQPPTGFQENRCQFLPPNPSCSSFFSVAMMKHLNKQFWEEGVSLNQNSRLSLPLWAKSRQEVLASRSILNSRRRTNTHMPKAQLAFSAFKQYRAPYQRKLLPTFSLSTSIEVIKTPPPLPHMQTCLQPNRICTIAH